jgi:hypothetical protein
VLDGNPIKSIRRDIIGKGTMAIMQHLQNRLGEVVDGSQEAAAHSAHMESTAIANQAKFGHLLEFSNKGRGVEQVPAAIWTAADGQPISKAILSKNGLREFPYPLFSFASTLHGARFRQKFTLEDAIGSHTCSLEDLAGV